MEDLSKLFCGVFKTRRSHGPFFGVLLLAAVLSSCTGSAASADDVPKIVASAGETVLLPCNTTASGDVPTVEWTKQQGSDSVMAFLYRDGYETFEMKHQDFRYRTHLIMHELHHGNLSMLMSNVQPSDSGQYQCMIRSKTEQVIRRLELFVGAVSEPRLSVGPGVGGGLTLQCEARCWFPEPLITLFDDQGNEISAEDPKRNEERSGCFTVRRRVTLQTATNRVTCRVHQPEINQTKDSEIYIPGECLRSYTAITATTAAVTTIIVVCICAGVVAFLVKKHYFSGGQPNSSLGNEGDRHKSKPSRVQQARQFTNDPRSSPDTSKRDVPPPPKSAYNSDPPKPASSADSGRPQSGSLPQTNDSKPAVSGQNPVFVKKSSHGGRSAASTSDGAAPSTPPPDSKEKPLPRSMSLSEKQPRAGAVRSPRRNTLSAMSSNRFSVLMDVSEEAKPLI